LLVPWAREGSCFTLLFEALALSMCQGLPVRQSARMLRVRDKQLWRRIDHYVGEARRKQDMSRVSFVGIDETSLRKGHQYVTVVHDLDEKRLLFATPGKDHEIADLRRALPVSLEDCCKAQQQEQNFLRPACQPIWPQAIQQNSMQHQLRRFFGASTFR
jgi:Helix-turn-helix domain of transposase family ISL3/Transposase